MIFLDNLKSLRLYKKKVTLPINLNDKKKGSAIFLLSPSYQSSINFINNSEFFDTRFYNSYFLEKDISFIINSNGMISSPDENQLSESASNYIVQPIMNNEEYEFTDMYMRTNENMIVFGDADDDGVLLEANSSYDTLLKRILFTERIKTNAEILEIYKKVMADCPSINKTKVYLEMYKKFNLFIDLSYYNEAFFKNNTYKLKKGAEIYIDFLDRLFNDKRLKTYGYNLTDLIVMPISEWNINKRNQNYLIKNSINPVSVMIYLLKTYPGKLQELWGDKTFLMYTNKGYFKFKISELDLSNYNKFIMLIDNLNDPNYTIEEDNERITSSDGIAVEIINKIEKNTNTKIDKVSPDDTVKDDTTAVDNAINTSNNKEIKQILVNKINDIAKTSADEEDAIETMSNDEDINKIMSELIMNPEDGVKIDAARSARLTTIKNEFNNKVINGKVVKDLLSTDSSTEDKLPKRELKIDTISEDWKDLSFINFEKTYDLDADIIKIINSLSEMDYPVGIRNISIEDNSTSQDWILTYKVECEDSFGHRFTLTFDVPKFKDYRFMLLRGNDKVMNGQLILIPISKTGENTVQIVSACYNKIFIEKYGNTKGKTYPITDKIIKTLKKLPIDSIQIKEGENLKVCRKYELPMDYIDMASMYTRIETKNTIIYFSQDEIRALYPNLINKDSIAIPYAYDKVNKKVLFFDVKDNTISECINNIFVQDIEGYEAEYNKTISSNKYCYSRASILSVKIPLVIMMCYAEGLQKTMKRANIKYRVSDDKKYDKFKEDVIKFEDGYIIYELDYNSSLLMNGLKTCDTALYKLSDINSKAMYLDFLDNFGGRILSDGLENFEQVMIDPITKGTLISFKLPTEYCDILAYANVLLSDNMYTRHTDLSSNRYRTNEIVAAYVGKELYKSYGMYRTNIKRDKKSAIMTIKKTAIIDSILVDNTTSDLSILTPLLEIESANTASFKGLSGMNSERSYSLDKRIFDDTMINVLALSTGFAGSSAGVNRQSTIDMSIQGTRGFIKKTSKDDMSVTKTFCMTEALSPFAATRDDPIRMAMNFVQTSKHAMITNHSDPLLISNGADEAMPYMCSNTYSYKAKYDGVVKELTEEYMIVYYPEVDKCEYINLSKNVRKNSDGGFFVTVKLDKIKGLKVGSKVSKDQIIAYNKKVFSNEVGYTDAISYNIGPLCKVAMPISDEGYEDSAIISEWLSEALSFTMVSKVERVFDKNVNILFMAKKGQEISEGDPLIIFQDSFDDEDFNILLKNISDDVEVISDIGRVKVKSKITGVVEDIAIYRTVEKDDLSDSLRKIVDEYEAPITKMKNKLEKYDPDAAKMLPADYKLEATGDLKDSSDGVKIKFYLSYKNKMSVGNKLTYFSALKGVIKDIFPEGDEPTSEFRPEEKIHTIMSVPSANGRMTISPFINAGINKFLIELARKSRDIMGIKNKMLDEYLDIE
jgi:hypothetical protein